MSAAIARRGPCAPLLCVLGQLLACAPAGPDPVECGALPCAAHRLADAPASVVPGTLEVASGSLYWLQYGGEVQRYTIGDAAPTVLGRVAPASALDVPGLAVLGDTVYFSFGDTRGVFAVPTDGGEPTTAFPDFAVNTIVTQDGRLFWGTDDGRLMLGDPADGSMRALAELALVPVRVHVAAAGCDVQEGRDHQVLAILGAAHGPRADVAVDAAGYYWIDRSGELWAHGRAQ